MNIEKITVYGTEGCKDCCRARQFFIKHQIPFEWIDIDENLEAEEIVRKINQGKRIIPTIQYSNSKILIEPTEELLLDIFT